jgi:hypothetical protein
MELERPPGDIDVELVRELRHPTGSDIAPRSDVIRDDGDLHGVVGHAVIIGRREEED